MGHRFATEGETEYLNPFYAIAGALRKEGYEVGTITGRRVSLNNFPGDGLGILEPMSAHFNLLPSRSLHVGIIWFNEVTYRADISERWMLEYFSKHCDGVYRVISEVIDRRYPWVFLERTGCGKHDQPVQLGRRVMRRWPKGGFWKRRRIDEWSG